MKCGTISRKKQKIWIWIAVDRATGEVLAWEAGSRGSKSLKRLLAKISHVTCDYYATDHWKVYKKFIPENKLLQSKAETQRIESTNNRIRLYLKCFNRKTLCYTKSKHMLLASLTLYFDRDNIIALAIPATDSDAMFMTKYYG